MAFTWLIYNPIYKKVVKIIGVGAQNTHIPPIPRLSPSHRPEPAAVGSVGAARRGAADVPREELGALRRGGEVPVQVGYGSVVSEPGLPGAGLAVHIWSIRRW